MHRTLFSFSVVAAALVMTTTAHAQDPMANVTVRLKPASGVVYFVDTPDGDGGGNVAASIGPDGILLVDDMFAAVAPKLQAALKDASSLPVRIVLNTHFHGDHIQANRVFGKTATIIAHENVLARLTNSAGPLPYPIVTFTDEIRVRFNGEVIRMRHFPTSHTDGDAVIFFETSHVLHLGDMFFFGMFPAVYPEGGGNIRQLIKSLERVLADYPADTKVVPGHGELATMADLNAYVTMLKETVAAAEEGIRAGQTSAQIEKAPAMLKYSKLGEGGAQTLPQYVAMLVKLLGPAK